MNKNGSPDKTMTLGSTGKAAKIIGPYHLLQKIGEGGMGEVWVAEQHKPIHRRVALKLIKAGMDTKQVIARFESERQALAMMDHPAIAKVFDAGETSDGRPYFVMEYVQGIPITTYCDQNRMTTTERLKLFMHACEGVQHAHQKAVIHRDLKPSNILVAIQDGKPVPKIIDFGVAKATAQSLTERTMYTELGMLIGTPGYMSPEQAEMSGLNIDTRTDVYSLGAILYELLVGALPFDPRELRRAGFDEIRRKIREEDPPKPSSRLSTMGEASTVSAQNRQTEPPSLVREIKGDLDWITMKALEKDRTRRYGTPTEFIADIERFLHHQPIIARPPSASYRAKKFVRRHRIGVGVAASLAALLIAFSVTTAIQSRRIARERNRANQEAETAKQVSSFLVDLFEVAEPSEAVANSVTAREILDKGAGKIQEDLNAQPEVKATLMNTMGEAYQSLGLYKKAELLHEQSLKIQRQKLGAQNPEVGSTMLLLAQALDKQARYAEAEKLCRQAIQLLQGLGGSHEPVFAKALRSLAWILSEQAKPEEAKAVALEALALFNRITDTSEKDLAKSLNALGKIFYDQSDYPAAERAFGDAFEHMRKALGPGHPDTLAYEGNLATAWMMQGNYTKGEAAYREMLELKRERLGPEHPGIGTTLNNLGAALFYQQNYGEAESFYREALTLKRRTLGDRHPDVASSLNNLGQVLSKQHKYEEAERVLKEALEIERSSQSGNNVDLLGRCAVRAGKGSRGRAGRSRSPHYHLPTSGRKPSPDEGSWGQPRLCTTEAGPTSRRGAAFAQLCGQSRGEDWDRGRSF
jgi:serine/threonine protein kinase/Tfp pilus assembly protein PilF